MDMTAQSKFRRAHASKKSVLLPQQRAGFTITELMVVIGIMAVLSAILLPALNRAKTRSESIACLNNLRQLQTAWQMYTDDNNNELPPNDYINGPKLGSLTVTAGASWCPGNAMTDTSTTNIERGLLYSHVTSARVYHCPSDNAQVAGMTGTVARTRSYNMSGSINCQTVGQPTFRKIDDIQNPSPERLFVFIDVADNATDAHFAIGTSVKTWIDVPSDRHNQGASLSFADGHMERWRWKAAKKTGPVTSPVYSVEDLQDLQRLREATRLTE